MIFCRLAATCAILAAVVAANPTRAFQLITESEAELPSDLGAERGISRGPTIVAMSPAHTAGVLKSPLHLKVRFESHGASKIDVASVLVTYVKRPAIDLTERIKLFITDAGIDIEDAEVPPGTHTLRVEVTDTDGRTGQAYIVFSVSK
jgi:hypothetical protein